MGHGTAGSALESGAGNVSALEKFRNLSGDGPRDRRRTFGCPVGIGSQKHLRAGAPRAVEGGSRVDDGGRWGVGNPGGASPGRGAVNPGGASVPGARNPGAAAQRRERALVAAVDALRKTVSGEPVLVDARFRRQKHDRERRVLLAQRPRHRGNVGGGFLHALSIARIGFELFGGEEPVIGSDDETGATF